MGSGAALLIRASKLSTRFELGAGVSVLRQTYRVTGPLDLRRTLSPLSHGPGDATIRFGPGRVWWATRTPDGPVALALAYTAGAGEELTVEAHGPGAERAL